MKFIGFQVGRNSVLAEGEMSDPMDRRRLSEIFEHLLESGEVAIVPASTLDACCRRGLTVTRLDDVPGDTERVLFFKRNI